MLAALGRDSDRQVATRYGIPGSAVRRKRRILGRAAAPRCPPVPARLLRLLGQVSDRSLALRYRIPVSRVCDERIRRRIPPATRPNAGIRHRWTTDMDRHVGTVVDAVLAKRFGMSTQTVCRRRQFLGISPFGSAQVIRWTPAMLKALGRYPDRVLAARWGICADSVTVKRHAMRKPRFTTLHYVWTKSRIAALGTRPDHDLAARWGISGRIVTEKRRALRIAPLRAEVPSKLTPAMRRQLGTTTDRALARLWSVAEATVTRYRAVNGVVRFRPNDALWTPQRLGLLGRVPDRALAQRWKMPLSTVNAKRMRLRIPPAPTSTWRPNHPER